MTIPPYTRPRRSQTGIYYGLLSGFLCAGVFASFFTGMHQLYAMAYAICAVLVVLGIHQEKRRFPATFDFARGVQTGLSTAIITGLIVSMFTALYLKYINPDWVQHDLDRISAQLQSMKKYSPKEINNLLGDRRASFSAFRFGAAQMSAFLFIGGVASLLTSYLLTRRKRG